jgi:hypothetical protein
VNDQDEVVEEKIRKMRAAIQSKHIVLSEYMIDSDVEQANISKMYIK